MTDDIYFVDDLEKAFEPLIHHDPLLTRTHMYMYSIGNVHYYKDSNTREYLKIEGENLQGVSE